MSLASLLADAHANSDSWGPWFFELISGKNKFWSDNAWLKKEQFEPFLNGVRATLTAVGAALLMYEARAYKLGTPVPYKWKRNIAILFTVLGFGVYFDYFNPNTRYSEYYHRHEFYHYYLGSKFFNEVGYTRLYECTAIAEVELGRGANIRKRDIRDLRDNLIKPTVDTEVIKDPKHCTDHFAKDRWAAFKKDVDWFYKSAAGSYWENMIKDHGYNPPPVWTMTGKFFANMGVADDGFFKWLACIDIFLHLGAVAMLVWAFGWRTTAIAVVFWGCNKAADFYWTGGAFIRQDWWFFLVASLCLTRKRYFFLAGFALMWAALLRIFPAIFFGGWAIMILLHWFQVLRKKRQEPLFRRDHVMLVAGSVLALATLVPLSIASTGKDSYKDFFAHTLETHQNTALTNHMGLESIMVHNWDGRMRFLRNDNQDDPFEGWKANRSNRFDEMKPIFLAIVIGLSVWMAWAMRRSRLLWVALPLSLPLVCALSNLTCYYYSMFILAAAIVHIRPAVGPPMLITACVSSFMLWPPRGFYWVDDRFVAQAYLFIGFSLMLLWGYSRPFSMARLKAWLDGKPEPKTPPPPPSPRVVAPAK